MTTALLAPDPLMVVERPKVAVSTVRTTGYGVFLIGLGALCALGFGLGAGKGAQASFDLTYGTSVTIAPFTVWTQPVAVWLGVMCAVLGIALVALPRILMRMRGVFLGLGILATIWCLLMWAQRSTPGFPFSLGGFVTSSVAYATILIFGSLSGTVSERSGVVNIAIEGQFLAGAFCGSLVGSVVANSLGTGAGYLVGAIAGIVVGALFGALLAYLALRYGANQIIAGIVLSLFATGLTNYLSFQLINYPNLNTGNVAPFLGIPILDKIPLLGPAIFDQNLFAYSADVLVIVVSFALFRTRWGLRVRAVGEHPRAAETVGINVIRTRYKSTILGGAIAGLGGAYFTLGEAGAFAPGLTAGLGYIALATMIFGQWRPYRCLSAALLFGSMVVLENSLQIYNTGINNNLLSMLPYVVTILVVCGLVGRVRPPAADGIPYSRE